MADGEDKDQKTEAPSAKKIEDAAKKGDVPTAQDVKHIGIIAAALVMASGGLVLASEIIGRASITFWGRASEFEFTEAGMRSVMAGVGGILAKSLAIPFALVVLGAILAAGLQGKLVVSSHRIQPQWSRVSPSSGFKRIFGGKSLMNFGKTFAKLILVGAAVWTVVPDVQSLIIADTPTVGGVVWRIVQVATKMLWAVVIAAIALALLDITWTRFDFMKRMKMSREELKKEAKDSDGDPHIKARRRQIAIKLSRRQALKDMEKATVIVMNPTHYAVALLYEHGKSFAPAVVAKGLDRLALEMRAKAEKQGIVVFENPPLARALYAKVDVGEFIPEDMFKDVADVISYVLTVQK